MDLLSPHSPGQAVQPDRRLFLQDDLVQDSNGFSYSSNQYVSNNSPTYPSSSSHIHRRHSSSISSNHSQFSTISSSSPYLSHQDIIGQATNHELSNFNNAAYLRARNQILELERHVSNLQEQNKHLESELTKCRGKLEISESHLEKLINKIPENVTSVSTPLATSTPATEIMRSTKQKPPALNYTQYPKVKFWNEVDYRESAGDTIIGKKQKVPGHQVVDPNEPNTSYLFLEDENGVAITNRVLTAMGDKAQTCFNSLNIAGLAPSSWLHHASSIAWGFLEGEMLNEFICLRLCKGNYKLKSWIGPVYTNWRKRTQLEVMAIKQEDVATADEDTEDSNDDRSKNKKTSSKVKNKQKTRSDLQDQELRKKRKKSKEKANDNAIDLCDDGNANKSGPKGGKARETVKETDGTFVEINDPFDDDNMYSFSLEDFAATSTITTSIPIPSTNSASTKSSSTIPPSAATTSSTSFSAVPSSIAVPATTSSPLCASTITAITATTSNPSPPALTSTGMIMTISDDGRSTLSTTTTTHVPENATSCTQTSTSPIIIYTPPSQRKPAATASASVPVLEPATTENLPKKKPKPKKLAVPGRGITIKNIAMERWLANLPESKKPGYVEDFDEYFNGLSREEITECKAVEKMRNSEKRKNAKQAKSTPTLTV